MSVPRISVVMATCNGAPHLDAQLESILGQSLAPCEVIVSDDASDDETLAIVEAAVAKALIPFRVFTNPTRLGYRENFLSAALRARGDLVAFCDQDDVWRPDKLRRCAATFENPVTMVCTHQAALIDEAGCDVGRFPQGIRRSRLRAPLSYRPWHTFWGFSLVFRRALLEMSPPETRYRDYIDPHHLIAHDRWICFLGQLVGWTAEIAEPLVAYRQHGRNLFGAHSRSSFHSSLRQRSEVYASVASEMVELVRALDPTPLGAGSCFDPSAAQAYVSRELSMAQFRRGLHERPSWNLALAKFAQGVVKNRYGSAVRPGLEWRSLARDAVFVASKLRSSVESHT